MSNPRSFPHGVYIDNISPGKGARSAHVYATLRDASGEILIIATLEYITDQLRGAIIDPPIKKESE
jgi:hypothetical protein